MDGWLAGWVGVEGGLGVERMRELFVCLFERWFVRKLEGGEGGMGWFGAVDVRGQGGDVRVGD